MSKTDTTLLSEVVRIRSQYQRSIRLDVDFGRMDALGGYVCHKTAADVLDTMSKQISGSNQRAFTWTGPFGGGKSSLAVALASALGPDEGLRDKAREVLRLSTHPNFDEAFPVSKGWLVLPVVGKRGSVSDEISKTLNHALGSKASPDSAAEIIAELCAAASDDVESRPFRLRIQLDGHAEAALTSRRRLRVAQNTDPGLGEAAGGGDKDPIGVLQQQTRHDAIQSANQAGSDRLADSLTPK